MHHARHSFRSFTLHPHARAIDLVPRDDSSLLSTTTSTEADNGRSHRLLVVGLILGFFGVIIIGIILYWTKRMNLTERRKYMERLDEPMSTTTSPSKRRVSKTQTEPKSKEGHTSTSSASSSSESHARAAVGGTTAGAGSGANLKKSLSVSTRNLLRSASTSSSNLLRSASSSSTNLLRSKTFARTKESNTLAAKITPFSLNDSTYGSHTNLPGQLEEYQSHGHGDGNGNGNEAQVPGQINGYGHGPRFVHTPGENMRIATRLENGIWVFSDPKRTRGGLATTGNESQVSLVSGYGSSSGNGLGAGSVYGYGSGMITPTYTPGDPFVASPISETIPEHEFEDEEEIENRYGNAPGSPFADPIPLSSSPLPSAPAAAAVMTRDRQVQRPPLQKAYSSNNVNVLDIPSSIYSLYGNSNSNVSLVNGTSPNPSSTSLALSSNSHQLRQNHIPTRSITLSIYDTYEPIGIHEPLSETIPRAKPRSASVLLEMQREQRERRERIGGNGNGSGSAHGHTTERRSKHLSRASLGGGVIYGTPYGYGSTSSLVPSGEGGGVVGGSGWEGGSTFEGGPGTGNGLAPGKSGWAYSAESEEPDDMSDFTHSDIHSYHHTHSEGGHSEVHSRVTVEGEVDRERRLREDIERYRRGEGKGLKVDTHTKTRINNNTNNSNTSNSNSKYAAASTSTSVPPSPFTPASTSPSVFASSSIPPTPEHSVHIITASIILPSWSTFDNIKT